MTFLLSHPVASIGVFYSLDDIDETVVAARRAFAAVA